MNRVWLLCHSQAAISSVSCRFQLNESILLIVWKVTVIRKKCKWFHGILQCAATVLWLCTFCPSKDSGCYVEKEKKIIFMRCLIIPCYSLLSSQIRYCTTQLLLSEERRVFWINDELEWLDKEPKFTLIMFINPLWKLRYR